MRLRAEILCVYESERVARAIAEALTPDNLDLPAGLSVKTEAVGKSVQSKITLDGKIETLLNTLDDLLSCTQIAESAIEEGGVKKRCS